MNWQVHHDIKKAGGNIISSRHKVSAIEELSFSMSLCTSSFEHSALKNLLSSINGLATSSGNM
jgi:hypothetical protein